MNEKEIDLVIELDKYISKKLTKKQISKFLAGYIHYNLFGNLQKKKNIIDNYIKEVLEK